jgi:hypothetical protein
MALKGPPLNYILSEVKYPARLGVITTHAANSWRMMPWRPLGSPRNHLRATRWLRALKRI